MSEKRNIFGQVYDFFDELNQQQREMDVRDAARNRGPRWRENRGLVCQGSVSRSGCQRIYVNEDATGYPKTGIRKHAWAN